MNPIPHLRLVPSFRAVLLRASRLRAVPLQTVLLRAVLLQAVLLPLTPLPAVAATTVAPDPHPVVELRTPTVRSRLADPAEPGGTPGPVAPTGLATFVPEWAWPLDGAPTILRPFEKPQRAWQRGHRGVDLAMQGGAGAGSGASILSPADGVVTFSGTVVDRGVLSIDHGGGRVSSFEPVSTELRKGQSVGEGDVVAVLADSAAASGPWHCGSPCVHWGVRVDGDYVDPLAFVMDRRPSVLLPLEE